jgi:hypothetical protein
MSAVILLALSDFAKGAERRISLRVPACLDTHCRPVAPHLP